MYLNYSVSRQVMTGFIVCQRVTGLCRLFGGLVVALILLAHWWLWQQQAVFSLDPIALAPLSESNSSANPFNHSQSP